MIFYLKSIRIRYCISTFRVVKQTVNDAFPAQRYYLIDQENKKRSFWNDININLRNDQITCCIEIPKERIAKMELIKELPFHPIVQDTRKNIYDGKKQKRYYAQYPYFNYGFIPQTWQQNITANQDGIKGDDDPLDIVELSQKKRNIGDIFNAKILGSFCLIDQNQIDWKIITLDVQEAKNRNISQISDLKLSLERLTAIKQWFKLIKTYDRKKQNHIAYNQKIFNKQQTIKVIQKMHKNWQDLLKKPQYTEKRKQFKISS